MTILHKNINLTEVQVKLDPVGGMKFSGYASKFNDIDSYNDTIAPGAYTKTLENRTRPIRLRWNHYGEIIGKWVTLKEDEYGLYVEGELTPNHSKAQDVYALLKHGAIDGLSIGFYLKDYETRSDGVRVIKEAELVEISVVEDPADLGAKIGDVKSALNEMKTLKEIETLLRDAGGFSRNDATALVSRIKSLCQSDSDAEEKQKEAIKRAFERLTAK
jgi:hypothetical protein